MDCQYHTTGIERDDCLLLECGIVEVLFHPFHSIIGGGILFRGDGAEGWEHSSANRPSAEKEGACNLHDKCLSPFESGGDYQWPCNTVPLLHNWGGYADRVNIVILEGVNGQIF